MKRKILSLMLAAALTLGLAVPALAAGQTFSDVPSSYWGYADIEAVAEAGLMNGTGGGAFSPEMKVSVAQFLTLLGRLVFPDVKAEGADWFGPYVTAAKDAGLLTGTQVDTSNVEAEISRYDMAVILRAAAKKLGVAEKSAQSSEVKDYGMVPTMYADAVLAVYGMGLIKGDQAGNFNGSNTMMRAEVATVIMRLAKAKPGGTTTEPEPQPDSEEPKSETVMATIKGNLNWYAPNHWRDYTERSPIDQRVAYELRYTEDGGRTYRVITTGITNYRDPNQPDKSSASFLDTTPFEVERNLFENEDGQFYISAETHYKDRAYSDIAEQHLVTWDRRDVRASIYPLQFEASSDGNCYTVSNVDVPLVPPTSKTVTVEFEGKCEAYVWPDGDKIPHAVSPSDITVKLAYCPDGYAGWVGEKNGGRHVKILGEVVTDNEGNFHFEIEVDELDYYPDKSLYTMYAEAIKEGMFCYFNPENIVTMEDLKRDVGNNSAQSGLPVKSYDPSAL